MMYSIAGLVLALGVAAAAWQRSRSAGGFYDAQVYGMDRATHRRYCAISLGFAAFFALACVLHLYGAGIAALDAVRLGRRVLRYIVPPRRRRCRRMSFASRRARIARTRSSGSRGSARTFARAAAEDRPILLSISAVWCHWCHVMDETTYSDPGVIETINRRFVPVRVDNDRRPDINARYNMGGWPTTAFLTPDGRTLTGATYLPPAQMHRALEEIARFYHDRKDEIGELPAASRSQDAQR